MVEEYSNEEIEHSNDKIYSHDNLDTNSGQSSDNDTLMVDSILNMVKPDDINIKHFDNISETKIENNSEHKSEHNSEHNLEHKSDHNLEENSENNSEHNSEENVIMEDKSKEDLKLLKKKLSLDALNKKKLEELQEIANQYGIDINNDNGKKKRKVDLAQEIFSKQ